MSKNESIARLTDEILEEQLVDILERYQLINWKQAGLEVLIKYAQREKEYWENSNNPQNTMFIVDPKTGQHYKDIKGNKVVGNFMYLTLKKPGKSMTNDAGVRKELYNWIVDNVPPDSLDAKELDDL